MAESREGRDFSDLVWSIEFVGVPADPENPNRSGYRLVGRTLDSLGRKQAQEKVPKEDGGGGE